MLSTEIHVGRLLEIRWSQPTSVQEFATRMPAYAAMVRDAPKKLVIGVDLRGLTIVSQDLADLVLKVMQQDNPKVERSGYILPSDSSLLLLQLSRLVREANYPNRQLFTGVPALTLWLGEVLDAAERARLAEFLG